MSSRLERAFPDHHVYSQDEIDSVIRAAKEIGANALITTAKDAVKLRRDGVLDAVLRVGN
jgi:tetraacyldisaccharide 4'-kinase